MRVIRFFVALCCLLAGAVVGALNRQPAIVDLGVRHVSSSLGVVILVSLLCGLLLGGFAVAASRMLPTRRPSKATHRNEAALRNPPP